MQTRFFAADSFPPDLYHRFMNANFRRAGPVFYQPICRHCRACMQIRVSVSQFQPTTSHRRCSRRNQDLLIHVGQPQLTDEKLDLYRRYITRRHHAIEPTRREGLEAFLYTSPIDTIEITYRGPTNQLLAVGICDVCSHSLSSVYFYFDPNELRRGLGTFGALHEIRLAQSLNLPHYYLGYWVQGCPSMNYKSTFRPCEVLHPDGTWHTPPK
jgi:arginine-tRNA-protein transferase